MFRAGLILLALGIAVLGFTARAAQYYKYQDDQGAIHYLEDPNQAPEKYRDRVKPVDTQITEEVNPNETLPGRWWRLSRHVLEDALDRLRYPRPSLAIPPARLSGPIWFTLKETRLLWTLIGEAVALVFFVAALALARQYPTQRERRRYSYSLCVAYLVLLVSSGLLLVRPQLKNFFVQADLNAELVLSTGRLSEAQEGRMIRFRESAQTWAKRIP